MNHPTTPARSPMEGKRESKSEPVPVPDDEITGVPGLRTWRSVYYFVAGSFILWVVLLTILSRVFS